MSDTSVTSRDLSLLRNIVHLTGRDRLEDPEELSFQVLDLLDRILGADGVSLQAIDSVHRSRSYVSAVAQGERFHWSAEESQETDNADGAEVFWEFWWTSPCSLPERTGRTVVTSLRSFYSQREWAAHPVRTNYLPFVDEIVLGYPTGPGQSVRILVPREEGSAFGYRELTLMELLEPHLRDLLLRTTSKPAPPQMLTERQLQILHLVERGMTNREIGRTLGIRESTVRKHLEHAYLRLGVLSRTGAVTAAFGSGEAG
jgi:DNA-binding CsgD family transcriptional regulator